MIEFKNVSKNFKSVKVLKNISFRIKKGDLVAIIGASGCGKTTILKMINRLVKESSGEIFINGEAIHSKDIMVRYYNMIHLKTFLKIHVTHSSLSLSKKTEYGQRQSL